MLKMGERVKCAQNVLTLPTGKVSVSFFLALDAGGTKTDSVIADETREPARVRTGTIKRMRTDAETAAQKPQC